MAQFPVLPPEVVRKQLSPDSCRSAAPTHVSAAVHAWAAPTRFRTTSVTFTAGFCP